MLASAAIKKRRYWSALIPGDINWQEDDPIEMLKTRIQLVEYWMG